MIKDTKGVKWHCTHDLVVHDYMYLLIYLLTYV